MAFDPRASGVNVVRRMSFSTTRLASGSSFLPATNTTEPCYNAVHYNTTLYIMLSSNGS